jgi:hypothetical protein
MKSSLAHLSPTVLAFGAAIGLSLSLFLLSGAGLQGGAIPLLPALGGAAGSVDMTPPSAPTDRNAPAPAASPISAALQPLAPALPAPTSHPVVHRVHRVHHAPARARDRVVRPARPATTPPAPVAVAAPAPSTSVSAPQPVRGPRGKAKALGHQHGHAARPSAAGTPTHGNGHTRRHSPEHHQGLPPGQAKKAPSAPPKAKGGGAPADHSGGNGDKGGKK